jgi:hypothetical protein
MKLLELIAPLVGATVVAALSYEARRRRSQLKKLQRVCKDCHQANISREHIPAKLSPDLSGGFFRQLFSQGDYLCQTWVTCHSPGCPSYGQTYSEKTRPKHWTFWHKISRTGELRKMVPIECLIQDEVVRHIIESRKPKSSKKKLSFPKPPIPNLGPSQTPNMPFGDINISTKGFSFRKPNQK